MKSFYIYVREGMHIFNTGNDLRIYEKRLNRKFEKSNMEGFVIYKIKIETLSKKTSQ